MLVTKKREVSVCCCLIRFNRPINGAMRSDTLTHKCSVRVSASESEDPSSKTLRARRFLNEPFLAYKTKVSCMWRCACFVSPGFSLWVLKQCVLQQLMTFVAEERKKHTVYPPPHQVFTWTQMCKIEDVSFTTLNPLNEGRKEWSFYIQYMWTQNLECIHWLMRILLFLAGEGCNSWPRSLSWTKPSSWTVLQCSEACSPSSQVALVSDLEWF